MKLPLHEFSFVKATAPLLVKHKKQKSTTNQAYVHNKK